LINITLFIKMNSVIRKIIYTVKVNKLHINTDDEWVICDNSKTIQRTLKNTLQTQVRTNNNLCNERKLEDIAEAQTHIAKPFIPIRLVSSELSIVTNDINLEESLMDTENGIVYDIYTAIVDVILNSDILSIFYFLNNVSFSISGL